MVQRGSKKRFQKTNTSNFDTGLVKKTLVGFNALGRSVPVYIDRNWVDGVFELLESVDILGETCCKVKGTFWKPDLALKFYAAGSGRKSENNWSRSLAIACKESSELQSNLFERSSQTIPEKYLTLLSDSQVKSGLNAIESSYAQYLQEGYKSLGVHIFGAENPVPKTYRT